MAMQVGDEGERFGRKDFRRAPGRGRHHFNFRFRRRHQRHRQSSLNVPPRTAKPEGLLAKKTGEGEIFEATLTLRHGRT